ncbi:hypothetical protein GCM10025867_28620 [Frondihabitans sucicola]|uniref:ABC transporter ATP-binding protein n=1 Tax=Frondihabitans sucicola TaxID=1268041 RepID=A0ABM8GQ84_9MICO|nr:hypothetical protein GCM10025867_28620 [Frondihabitans sucicola]
MLAIGTPEQLAKVPESHTGRFLAEILSMPRAEIPAPAKARKPRAKALAR